MTFPAMSRQPKGEASGTVRPVSWQNARYCAQVTSVRAR